MWIKIGMNKKEEEEEKEAKEEEKKGEKKNSIFIELPKTNSVYF